MWLTVEPEQAEEEIIAINWEALQSQLKFLKKSIFEIQSNLTENAVADSPRRRFLHIKTRLADCEHVILQISKLHQLKAILTARINEGASFLEYNSRSAENFQGFDLEVRSLLDTVNEYVLKLETQSTDLEQNQLTYLSAGDVERLLLRAWRMQLVNVEWLIQLGIERVLRRENQLKEFETELIRHLQSGEYDKTIELVNRRKDEKGWRSKCYMTTSCTTPQSQSKDSADSKLPISFSPYSDKNNNKLTPLVEINKRRNFNELQSSMIEFNELNDNFTESNERNSPLQDDGYSPPISKSEKRNYILLENKNRCTSPSLISNGIDSRNLAWTNMNTNYEIYPTRALAITQSNMLSIKPSSSVSIFNIPPTVELPQQKTSKIVSKETNENNILSCDLSAKLSISTKTAPFLKSIEIFADSGGLNNILLETIMTGCVRDSKRYNKDYNNLVNTSHKNSVKKAKVLSEPPSTLSVNALSISKVGNRCWLFPHCNFCSKSLNPFVGFGNNTINNIHSFSMNFLNPNNLAEYLSALHGDNKDTVLNCNFSLKSVSLEMICNSGQNVLLSDSDKYNAKNSLYSISNAEGVKISSGKGSVDYSAATKLTQKPTPTDNDHKIQESENSCFEDTFHLSDSKEELVSMNVFRSFKKNDQPCSIKDFSATDLDPDVSLLDAVTSGEDWTQERIGSTSELPLQPHTLLDAEEKHTKSLSIANLQAVDNENEIFLSDSLTKIRRHNKDCVADQCQISKSPETLHPIKELYATEIFINSRSMEKLKIDNDKDMRLLDSATNRSRNSDTSVVDKPQLSSINIMTDPIKDLCYAEKDIQSNSQETLEEDNDKKDMSLLDKARISQRSRDGSVEIATQVSDSGDGLSFLNQLDGRESDINSNSQETLQEDNDKKDMSLLDKGRISQRSRDGSVEIATQVSDSGGSLSFLNQLDGRESKINSNSQETLQEDNDKKNMSLLDKARISQRSRDGSVEIATQVSDSGDGLFFLNQLDGRETDINSNSQETFQEDNDKDDKSLLDNVRISQRSNEGSVEIATQLLDSGDSLFVVNHLDWRESHMNSNSQEPVQRENGQDAMPLFNNERDVSRNIEMSNVDVPQLSTINLMTDPIKDVCNAERDIQSNFQETLRKNNDKDDKSLFDKVRISQRSSAGSVKIATQLSDSGDNLSFLNQLDGRESNIHSNSQETLQEDNDKDDKSLFDKVRISQRTSESSIKIATELSDSGDNLSFLNQLDGRESNIHSNSQETLQEDNDKDDKSLLDKVRISQRTSESSKKIATELSDSGDNLSFLNQLDGRESDINSNSQEMLQEDNDKKDMSLLDKARISQRSRDGSAEIATQVSDSGDGLFFLNQLDGRETDINSNSQETFQEDNDKDDKSLLDNVRISQRSNEGSVEIATQLLDSGDSLFVVNHLDWRESHMNSNSQEPVQRENGQDAMPLFNNERDVLRNIEMSNVDVPQLSTINLMTDPIKDVCNAERDIQSNFQETLRKNNDKDDKSLFDKVRISQRSSAGSVEIATQLSDSGDNLSFLNQLDGRESNIHSNSQETLQEDNDKDDKSLFDKVRISQRTSESSIKIATELSDSGDNLSFLNQLDGRESDINSISQETLQEDNDKDDKSLLDKVRISQRTSESSIKIATQLSDSGDNLSFLNQLDGRESNIHSNSQETLQEDNDKDDKSLFDKVRISQRTSESSIKIATELSDSGDNLSFLNQLDGRESDINSNSQETLQENNDKDDKSLLDKARISQRSSESSVEIGTQLSDSKDSLSVLNQLDGRETDMNSSYQETLQRDNHEEGMYLLVNATNLLRNRKNSVPHTSELSPQTNKLSFVKESNVLQQKKGKLGHPSPALAVCEIDSILLSKTQISYGSKNKALLNSSKRLMSMNPSAMIEKKRRFTHNRIGWLDNNLLGYRQRPTHLGQENNYNILLNNPLQSVEGIFNKRVNSSVVKTLKKNRFLKMFSLLTVKYPFRPRTRLTHVKRTGNLNSLLEVDRLNVKGSQSICIPLRRSNATNGFFKQQEVSYVQSQNNPVELLKITQNETSDGVELVLNNAKRNNNLSVHFDCNEEKKKNLSDIACYNKTKAEFHSTSTYRKTQFNEKHTLQDQMKNDRYLTNLISKMHNGQVIKTEKNKKYKRRWCNWKKMIFMLLKRCRVHGIMLLLKKKRNNDYNKKKSNEIQHRQQVKLLRSDDVSYHAEDQHMSIVNNICTNPSYPQSSSTLDTQKSCGNMISTGLQRQTNFTSLPLDFNSLLYRTTTLLPYLPPNIYFPASSRTCDHPVAVSSYVTSSLIKKTTSSLTNINEPCISSNDFNKINSLKSLRKDECDNLPSGINLIFKANHMTTQDSRTNEFETLPKTDLSDYCINHPTDSDVNKGLKKLNLFTPNTGLSVHPLSKVNVSSNLPELSRNTATDVLNTMKSHTACCSQLLKSVNILEAEISCTNLKKKTEGHNNFSRKHIQEVESKRKRKQKNNDKQLKVNQIKERQHTRRWKYRFFDIYKKREDIELQEIMLLFHQWTTMDSFTLSCEEKEYMMRHCPKNRLNSISGVSNDDEIALSPCNKTSISSNGRFRGKNCLPSSSRQLTVCVVIYPKTKRPFSCFCNSNCID